MVRSWMDENAWYIEIEDNGMGMTQEEADLILENEMMCRQIITASIIFEADYGYFRKIVVT